MLVGHFVSLLLVREKPPLRIKATDGAPTQRGERRTIPRNPNINSDFHPPFWRFRLGPDEILRSTQNGHSANPSRGRRSRTENLQSSSLRSTASSSRFSFALLFVFSGFWFAFRVEAKFWWIWTFFFFVCFKFVSGIFKEPSVAVALRLAFFLDKETCERAYLSASRAQDSCRRRLGIFHIQGAKKFLIAARISRNEEKNRN